MKEEHLHKVVERALRGELREFAVVLVSRPSVGKGELSNVLESLGLAVIPCSRVLRARAAINPDDSKWRKVLEDLDNDILASDEATFESINWKVGMTATRKPVFDGFPRNKKQVVYLSKILDQLEVPCLTIELECDLKEANRRREQRVQKAHEKAEEPRKGDVNVAKWKSRQEEYDKEHPSLTKALRELSSDYVVINTTHGTMLENHSKILIEILWFAMKWHRRKR